jgi:phosphatidylserine decarboxylase
MASAALITLSVFAVAVSVLSLALLLLYRFYFLRKPIRTLPPENTIVSPANGTIARIIDIKKRKKEVVNKGLLGKVDVLVKDVARSGYLIVIVMTPFNVHYQRSPVQGVVQSTRHTKGRFLNAVKDARSLQALRNEKNEMVIRHGKIGKIKVVQVAGFLALRIRCFIKPKQKLHKGEEIGLICLGSQVILVMPRLKLDVKEGQQVIDGETIIARF